MFYKEIQLSRKPYTLHTLTREIQKQSGLTFSYNAAKIDPDRKIRLKSGTERLTVKELLTLIKKKTGIGYKIVSSTHIIYTEPLGKQNPKIRHKTREKKRKDNLPSVDKEEEISAKEPPPGRSARDSSTTGQQIMVVGDSSLAMSYYLSGGGGTGGAYEGGHYQKYPVVPEQEEGDTDDPEGRPQPQSRGRSSFSVPWTQSAAVDFLKKSTLLAAGSTADEVYYLNPTLKMGFDFLYGTLAYNIGAYPHWRYGIGASAQISERWDARFEFTTGRNINQGYAIRSFDTFPPLPDDSLQVPVLKERNTPLLVQSKLTRFSFTLEWNLSRNLNLGAGLILNLLKTTYFSNGNKVALSDILPIGYDADQKYRTINPPYLLGNSYTGNQSSNTKIWLGLQLSLVYRLNFFER